MSYAEITFQDKNRIKRWLQNRRLSSALKLCPLTSRSPATICDFGAGNGELIRLLAGRYPKATFLCYEPTPRLLSEARVNLNGFDMVELCSDVRGVVRETIDVVFCLEVFEHLPSAETANALQQIYDLLRPGGTVVIGVPVEVGIPALYKGLFRMARRYGSFDAEVKNVALAFLGCPPTDRPVSEIAPGLLFHFEHMGFDFRRFRRTLTRKFDLRKVSASPFSAFGPLVMPEVYFVATKAEVTPASRTPP